MMKLAIQAVCFGGVIAGLSAVADNPLLQGYADPHMKVWNGRMYLAVGKDEKPDCDRFTMPYWSIYSSTDLMNWTLAYKVAPADTYLGEKSKICWAPDIATRNGKYYFYFSKGGFSSGVLEAAAPDGPYLDVLDKTPLLEPDAHHAHKYDPSVFTDDDGTPYVIFGRDGVVNGNISHYQIARLNDDMVSLAEPSRDLLTDEKYGFGHPKRGPDHNYFHKHNGLYYLSCGMAYMTSTNVYGPFSNLRHTSEFDGHSSFCEYNGQTYHAWEFTCDPYENRMYRQVMLTYVHYKDNGDMVDDLDFMQGGRHYACGVGAYDAAWGKIEAEWFFRKSGGTKKEAPGSGFEVQDLRNGDWLNFPNLKNLPANASLQFSVASASADRATIEIREDGPDGTLLGICKVPDTGGWSRYQTVECALSNEAQTTNLYLVFKGSSGELLRLDWFRIDH